MRRSFRTLDPIIPRNLCISCRLNLSQKRHASSTTVTSSDIPSTSSSPTETPSSAQPSSTDPVSYKVRTAVILSRPPILTRLPTPFEASYHLYNRRLNERLALPFTRYFYYRKGTPADGTWKRKVRSRDGTVARDIGIYDAYSKEGWNDEVLVGDKTGEREEIVSQILNDAEIEGRGGREALMGIVEEEKGHEDDEVVDGMRDVEEDKEENRSAAHEESQLAAESVVQGGVEGEDEVGLSVIKEEPVSKPLPRITEADTGNDTKSLNRKLDKTLYMLVKDRSGSWVFPGDTIQGKEGLHQAAERILVQAGGINMNTWVVGNAPIGHHKERIRKGAASQTPSVVGLKTFFMKARVMTGQNDIGKNIFGDTDFLWLSKDEIQPLVHEAYWSSIKNMLVER